jgi:hypothetical protein
VKPGERKKKIMKKVLVNQINKKHPLERSRALWLDIVAQDIKNIKEDSIFDDS